MAGKCKKTGDTSAKRHYISTASFILEINDTLYFNQMPDYLSKQLFSDEDYVLFRQFQATPGWVAHFFIQTGKPAMAVVLPAADTVKFPRDTSFRYDETPYYMTRVRGRPYYFFTGPDYGVITDDKILTENLIRNLPGAFMPDSLINTFHHIGNTTASAHWWIFPRRIPSGQYELFRNPYLFKHTGQMLIWDLENPGENYYNGVALNFPPERSLAEVFQSVAPYEVFHENLLPANTPSYTGLRFDMFPDFYRAWTDFKTYSGYRNDPLAAKNWKALKAVTQGGRDNAFLITRFSSTPEKIAEKLQPAFQYGETDIYISPDSLTLSRLFYPLLEKKSYPYVAIMENDWIWADTPGHLKALLDAVRTEHTLDKTDFYKQITRRASGHYHLIAKRNEIFYTLTYDDGVLFNTYHVLPQNTAPAGSPKSWETVSRIKLASPPAISPRWAYNHRSGKYEIVLQDRNKNLTLLTAKGKQRWKLHLNKTLNSPVYQADMFRNGKRQFIFSTPSGIYAVDIKGDYVPPFPVHKTLQSPVALFDYDNNRHYRLAFAENGRVYVYDLKGKEVKGFRPVRLSAPLQFAPQHIRIGTKDYILLQQTDGKLHIVNRRGQDRIKVKEKVKATKPWVAYKNRFVSINDAGEMVHIDRKGRIGKDKSFGKILDAAFTPRHSLLVTADKVYIDGKDSGLPPAEYISPAIFTGSNRVYYVLIDKASKEIILTDGKGNTERLPGDYSAELLIKPKMLYLLTRYNPGELLIYSRPR